MKFHLRARAHAGQVAIYLIMILVVVFTLALMNVDSFLAVRGKNRTQHAGDAAALAAARKQGSLLNEIGQLNFDHLFAALANDTNACEKIVLQQRRLALLGPIDALFFANQIAKKNGMSARDSFAEILRAHVNDIRLIYRGGENENGEPYPEPYPNAWTEYASALESVLAGELFIGPDNIEFYDAAGGHHLLNREFYYAIDGRDWCWFHFNDNAILSAYSSFRDWSPLPSRRENALDNCEIFSLHIFAKTCALSSIFSRKELIDLAKRFGAREVTEEDFAKNSLLDDPNQVWFFFDPARWHLWFDGFSLVGEDGNMNFPLIGEVKPEYNVRGCAAVCRCISDVASLARDDSSSVNWSAAAKPFGCIETDDGELTRVTAFQNFVVPCFTDVRLVARDAVASANLATADHEWITHLRQHVADYLLNGPDSLSACFYCRQLKTWESRIFRDSGVTWLKFNSGTCVLPRPGGPHAGGGTSYGH